MLPKVFSYVSVVYKRKIGTCFTPPNNYCPSTVLLGEMQINIKKYKKNTFWPLTVILIQDFH